MLKVVIDTNIFISHLIEKAGPSRSIMNAWMANRFQLIVSRYLFNELVATLKKPRLAKFILASEAAEFITLLEERVEFITPTHPINISRDPKDNMVIEAALAEKADIIISGDRDLLTLNPYKNIKIMTPGDFLKWLE